MNYVSSTIEAVEYLLTKHGSMDKKFRLEKKPSEITEKLKKLRRPKRQCITADTHDAIYIACENTDNKNGEIAKEFGVSEFTVWCIRRKAHHLYNARRVNGKMRLRNPKAS